MPGMIDAFNGPASGNQMSMQQPVRPEIPGWKTGAVMGMYGPQAAEQWKQRQLQPYRSKMTNYIIRNLMEGRPKAKTISGAEWVGLLHSMDSRLLGDEKLTKGLRFVVDQWNKQALATQQAAANRAKNMWDSMQHLGGAATPEQRQFMGGYGYQLRDWGAPLASSPGIMAGANRAAIGSKPKSNLKSTAFPGLIPSQSMLAAEKERAVRGVQQQMPTGQYVTRTNPTTGMQTRLWTGAQQQVDLGRVPMSTADYEAQVVGKFLNTGMQSLSEPEKRVLESRLAKGNSQDLMQVFALMAKGMNFAQAMAAQQSQGGGSAAGQNAQPTAPPANQSTQPTAQTREQRIKAKYPNAFKEANDWYVIQNGLKYKIEGE